MTDPVTLAALADRNRARAQFHETLGTLQDRLSPANLKAEASARVKETATNAVAAGKQTVREHPGKVAAGIGLAGLLLAGKPIARAISKRRQDDETDETPDELSPKRAAPRPRRKAT